MSDEPNINWIWIDDKMQYGFDEGWPSYSQNTLDILKAAQTDQAILKAIIEKAMVCKDLHHCIEGTTHLKSSRHYGTKIMNDQSS